MEAQALIFGFVFLFLPLTFGLLYSWSMALNWSYYASFNA